MKIAFFSTKKYDREYFDAMNKRFGHSITYFESRLKDQTVPLTRGFPCVCIFVNDDLNADVLRAIRDQGVKVIALRCAGFNNVDICAAADLGLTVVRVPAYSPHGVAEHAVAIMLALNRRLLRANSRVREGNFSLDGLIGFEVNGKTVGVIGTGKIGVCFAKIMLGFGTKVLAYDPFHNPELEKIGVQYLPLDEVIAQSDIISLHVPLMPETHYLINEHTISIMKKGAMLINTSRGGLIDTAAVIDGLKSGQIGSLALDVYEEEGNLFFRDLSGEMIHDDVFARLLTFPNVLITGHQGFFTDTALTNIAETTLQNIANFEKAVSPLENMVTCDKVQGPVHAAAR